MPGSVEAHRDSVVWTDSRRPRSGVGGIEIAAAKQPIEARACDTVRIWYLSNGPVLSAGIMNRT
jgi:hypothetical protein